MTSMRCLWGLGLLGAVACGEVQKTPADGMTGSDGPPNARGTVRAMVLDPSGSGAGAVGIPVVFVDPDGTVVKTANTDASGRVEADVLPGASVTTVFAASTTIFAVSTTLAIKPGDNLVLGTRNPDATSAGNLTVSWPSLPGSSMPASFAVFGPCGPAGTVIGSARSKQLTVQASCRHSPLEILVAALDGANNAIAFNSKTGITFTPGSSIALDDAWSGPVLFTASYTNVSQVTKIETERQVTDGFGWKSAASRDVAGSASLQITVPGPTGAAARIQTTLTGTNGGVQTILQNLAGSAGSYGLDVSTNALAWLGKPSFDATAHTVRVDRVAAGTTNARPDLFRVLLTWQRNQTLFSWTLSGPDASTVMLPTIPVSVGADVNPTASDMPQIDAVGFEADGIADYDAVRPNVGVAVDAFNGGSTTATLVRRSSSSSR